MSKVICITGMHRSGTSLTASWLEQCGLTIHDGNLAEPYVGNPKGHFEDKDFVDLHSSIINRNVRTAWGWKTTTARSLVFSEDDQREAKTLVQRRNRKFSKWGWKDPRTVDFLGAWKALLPDLKVIMVWRPYAETLQSLIRRSRLTQMAFFKITIIDATRFWLRYNTIIANYKQKFPNDTLVFSLNQILAHNQKVLSGINEKFNIGLNYAPISTVFDDKILHKKAPLPLHQELMRYCARACFNTNRLEQKLLDLSDLK